MKPDQEKAIVEAILFAAGKEVKVTELMSALEKSEEEVITLVNDLQSDYQNENRGIEIIKVENGYQLTTQKRLHEYLYPIFDKRNKPNLSQAALETLAIIAYNPKITRAEIESIRGVNSDGTIYKLLEYDLIENSGKLDAPGRPTTYSTTSNFLKMFGLTNLDELPDLPRYKVDENEQLVIDDLISKEEDKKEEKTSEAPMPKNDDSNEQSKEIVAEESKKEDNKK